jgi:hypothetical protein
MAVMLFEALQAITSLEISRPFIAAIAEFHFTLSHPASHALTLLFASLTDLEFARPVEHRLADFALATAVAFRAFCFHPHGLLSTIGR